LSPAPGTFHERLTHQDIDLSESKYNTKSCTRKKLLEFISEIIKSHPQIITHTFMRQGTRAHVIIVYDDAAIYSISFSLTSAEVYKDGFGYTKLTCREYLTSILAQESRSVRLDYPNSTWNDRAGFVYL
jgi:hypothetical protein